jgi:hypothetical protein
MISIRAFVIQTVTIPVFMASAEGKAWTLLVITGSSIAIAESCEFIAAANEIAEAMEEAVKGGAFVKGPGMDCNAQPHPYEPPED